MTQHFANRTLSRRRGAVLRAGLASVAMLTLAACHTTRSSEGTYDPRFVNYDQRHALSLQQGEQTMPLLVGANAHGLTSSDRTALAGFLQTYQARGESGLRVQVPQGAANSAAARRALADVHDVVAAAGANPSAVHVDHYHVGDATSHAPIVVVFDRLQAVTNPCGTWSDPFNPPNAQSDYYNFGCAAQANLGVMLDDPRDLVRPRGVGYPDAGRRAEVLTLYRSGQPTSTQASEESQASIAQVGQ
ncbi:MAG: CpaD family pilus assembly protein [Cohaesibacteraceae bacterium]